MASSQIWVCQPHGNLSVPHGNSRTRSQLRFALCVLKIHTTSCLVLSVSYRRQNDHPNHSIVFWRDENNTGWQFRVSCLFFIFHIHWCSTQLATVTSSTRHASPHLIMNQNTSNTRHGTNDVHINQQAEEGTLIHMKMSIHVQNDETVET